MNPNQMMIAKAMVSQTALRDEALRSRAARNRSQVAASQRTGGDRPRTGFKGIFQGVLGLGLAGRR